MTDFQTGFLSLIKASLLKTEPTVSAEFNFDEAYMVAERHQVLPLIYDGAMNVPSLQNQEVAGRFFERFCHYIAHNAGQQDVIRDICSLFEENGLSYMPLKGTYLKRIYPSPEMRVMGDADILIRTDEYDKIRSVMQSLGGVEISESDHEYIWLLSDQYPIELHKRLIPSYNLDYYEYYGDGWRLARVASEDSGLYEMSAEDMLIYLFTHFAKHYRDNGAGMKYVIDFFVYRLHYPNLDMEYVEQELTKLQLWRFYSNIMRLTEVWFGNEPSDDLMDFLTEKIFADGVYGREEHKVISEGVKLAKTARQARWKKLVNMAFPTYTVMCRLYPILEKCPVLLPVWWFLRLFDILFIHPERMKRHVPQFKRMTDENIDAYRRELNYVGLDFHFGKDGTKKDSETASMYTGKKS